MASVEAPERKFGTRDPELFGRLAAVFEPWEVKERSHAGRTFHYVTARTVMNRMDTVLGPENWWDDYIPLNDNSVMCRLTIRFPDGSTMTKCDAGGAANMKDAGDDDKSSFSDALKRSAVKFGIGRYLYNDGVPDFFGTGEMLEPARYEPRDTPRPSRDQDRGPARRDEDRRPARDEDRRGGDGEQRDARFGPPTTGKQLFAWTKSMEQKHNVGLLNYINKWAGLKEFPARMIDWDRGEVEQAYAEAQRKLQTLSGPRGEPGVDDEPAF